MPRYRGSGSGSGDFYFTRTEAPSGGGSRIFYFSRTSSQRETPSGSSSRFYDYYDDEPRGRSGYSGRPSPYREHSISPDPSRSLFEDTPPRRFYSPPPPSSRFGPEDDYFSRRPYSPRPSPFGSNPSTAHPPRSSYSAPEHASPVPYTYEDEEPDRIPHVAAVWNDFTTSSTGLELVSYFVRLGFPRGRAEREIAREFAAHAAQHRAGQTEPGPSRFAEAQARAYPSRSPSPRFSRWRSPQQDGSESPPPGQGRSRYRAHTRSYSRSRSPSPYSGRRYAF
jgi:hypothetical protein